MTHEDIIRWAREAGFFLDNQGYGPEVLHTDGSQYSSRCFERFAALVAATEREEFAKVCEKRITDPCAHLPEHVFQIFQEIDSGKIPNATFSHANVAMIPKDVYYDLLIELEELREAVKGI